MKKFTVLFAFIVSFQWISAQEKMIARIQDPGKIDYTELIKQNRDVLAYSPGQYIDVVVDQSAFDQLANEGYKISVLQTEAQVKQNLVVGKALNGYRSYSDMLTELQQIEAANPVICKLYDIGDSRGKLYAAGGNSNYNSYSHDIWAMKVSDNVTSEEDEPAVFYFGNHHAREPLSLETVMYILNYLIDNYGTDPQVTADINGKQIWFVPLVNPDGHKIVIDQTDVWWRKNVADNNGNGQVDSNGDGVDPNRNYSWEWGGDGSSGDPYNETYRGTSPASEPEIQAMQNLMLAHHFVTGITYHTYGELVLYPYGYANNTVAPDQGALSDLATAMAVSIPGVSGGNYTPEPSWQLYPAAGVTDDFAYGEKGIFCFTIEMATQFIPPAGDVDGICQDNLQAALILLHRIDHSVLTGLVKDANSNLPVEAEIFIDGIDNTGVPRDPYMSDAGFGRYYRLLQDGNYDVTFSSYGYLPQTFTGVNINSTGQTVLDVNLLPSQTVDVSGTVTDLDTGLPVENATVQILDTPLSPVTTNASGQYNIPGVMEGTYTFRVFAPDYATILVPENVSVVNTVFDFQLQESIAWSFESGSFEPYWEFGGNASWAISTENPYDGLYCSKSGAIGDQQTSEMLITVDLTSGGDISFYRKVSSEATYDFLKFYIDNVLQDQWSGEVAWGQATFAVSSGNHTFKWVYEKDYSVENGSDCAWVDYIQFPPMAPFPTAPDIDFSQLAFNVTLDQDQTGQEMLTIFNLGDLDLNFSISKQYQPSKAPLDYCAASGGCDEYISRVIFNTIDNSSGCDGYADYTSISTNVDPGQTYTLTIENGNIYSTDDLGVWIDWNQNGVFTDPGENVVCEYSNSGQGTYNVTVPVDALAGSTTMRIRIKYSGSDCGSSCGSTTYGEVEDYSIWVNGGFTDWLTVNPVSGVVTGNGQEAISLGIDPAGMDPGDYAANLTVTSNDADEPQTVIPVNLHVINGISADLKVFLQGPFDQTQMTADLNSAGLLPFSQPFSITPWNYSGPETVASIPDPGITCWVLVELRETAGDASTATASTMIARQAAFVMNDGMLINVEGLSPLRFDVQVNDNLFVVIYARNHLPVMSSEPLTETAGVYSWDFTNATNQAYGTNPMIEVSPGIWAMIAGDANNDGQIDQNDKTSDWESETGKAGYFSSDLNFDGQVNNLDKNEAWLPNLGKGSQVPE